ncbi:tyrosine-type recombinase/integrase [Rhodococcus pyridinivorans]|uniref:tyrosine-type recombinase/integrase n=1 Tax=Rhodococcus pyridinivorans TaxID=103816 RepID=UPI0036C3FF87
MARSRRGFGKLRKLPSGRWQASYVGPDGIRYTAPSTYAAKLDGEAWIGIARRQIEHEIWKPPGREKEAPVTFGAYAEVWLAQRTLRPRTRDLYAQQLGAHILPVLGDLPLRDITPAIIRSWHAGLGTEHRTRNAHLYRLANSIFGTAVEDEVLPANPCRIRGAGVSPKRTHDVVILSPQELAQLAEKMPAPLRASVLLAAWCGTRYGETTELRRKDLNKDCSVLQIRRAVVYRDGGFEVGRPKTDAGLRSVSVPPHIRPAVLAHLAEHVAPGADSLLFPHPDGGHLMQSHYRRRFKKAAEAIGKSELRVHDLRHVGAVLAAQAGATTAELMARIGHSSPDVAMKYQHAAQGRDALLAEKLSKLAE